MQFLLLRNRRNKCFCALEKRAVAVTWQAVEAGRLERQPWHGGVRPAAAPDRGGGVRRKVPECEGKEELNYPT